MADLYQPITCSIEDIKSFLEMFDHSRLIVQSCADTAQSQQYLNLNGVVYTPLNDGMSLSILSKDGKSKLIVGQYVLEI